MSWMKPHKSRIHPEDLKLLRGIHPYHVTPGPADFDILPAFNKSTRYKTSPSSNFGQTTEDRLRSSALGRKIKKGSNQPGGSLLRTAFSVGHYKQPTQLVKRFVFVRPGTVPCKYIRQEIAAAFLEVRRRKAYPWNRKQHTVSVLAGLTG